MSPRRKKNPPTQFERLQMKAVGYILADLEQFELAVAQRMAARFVYGGNPLAEKELMQIIRAYTE